MRNVECPKYDRCLTRAAKANSPGWDCGSCKHKTATIEMREFDITAYHLLLRAIFSPDQYARYRGSRGARRTAPRLSPAFGAA